MASADFWNTLSDLINQVIEQQDGLIAKRVYFHPGLGEIGEVDSLADGTNELYDNITQTDVMGRRVSEYENPFRIHIFESPHAVLPPSVKGLAPRPIYWMVVSPSWPEFAAAHSSLTTHMGEGDEAFDWMAGGVKLDDEGNIVGPGQSEIRRANQAGQVGRQQMARLIAPFKGKYMTDDDLLRLDKSLNSLRSSSTAGASEPDFQMVENVRISSLPRKVKYTSGQSIYTPGRFFEGLFAAHGPEGGLSLIKPKVVGILGKDIVDIMDSATGDFAGFDLKDLEEARQVEPFEISRNTVNPPGPASITPGSELSKRRIKGNTVIYSDPHVPDYLPTGSKPTKSTLVRGPEAITLLSGAPKEFVRPVTEANELLPADPLKLAAFLQDRGITLDSPKGWSPEDYYERAALYNRRDIDPKKVYFQSKTVGEGNLVPDIKSGDRVRDPKNKLKRGTIVEVAPLEVADKITTLPSGKEIREGQKYRQLTVKWDDDYMKKQWERKNPGVAPPEFTSEKLMEGEVERIFKGTQPKVMRSATITGPRGIAQTLDTVTFHRAGAATEGTAKLNKELGKVISIIKDPEAGKNEAGQALFAVETAGKQNPLAGDVRTKPEWKIYFKALGWQERAKGKKGLTVFERPQSTKVGKDAKRHNLSFSDRVVLSRVPDTDTYTLQSPRISPFGDEAKTLSEWRPLLKKQGFSYTGPLMQGMGDPEGSYAATLSKLKKSGFEEKTPEELIEQGGTEYKGKGKYPGWLQKQGSGAYDLYKGRAGEPISGGSTLDDVADRESYKGPEMERLARSGRQEVEPEPFEMVKKRPRSAKYNTITRLLDDFVDPMLDEPISYMVPNYDAQKASELASPKSWYVAANMPRGALQIPIFKPDERGQTSSSASSGLDYHDIPEGRYILRVEEAMPGGMLRYRIIGRGTGSPIAEEDLPTWNKLKDQLPSTEMYGSSAQLDPMLVKNLKEASPETVEVPRSELYDKPLIAKDVNWGPEDIEDFERYILRTELPNYESGAKFGASKGAPGEDLIMVWKRMVEDAQESAVQGETSSRTRRVPYANLYPETLGLVRKHVSTRGKNLRGPHPDLLEQYMGSSGMPKRGFGYYAIEEDPTLRGKISPLELAEEFKTQPEVTRVERPWTPLKEARHAYPPPSTFHKVVESLRGRYPQPTKPLPEPVESDIIRQEPRKVPKYKWARMGLGHGSFDVEGNPIGPQRLVILEDSGDRLLDSLDELPEDIRSRYAGVADPTPGTQAYQSGLTLERAEVPKPFADYPEIMRPISSAKNPLPWKVPIVGKKGVGTLPALEEGLVSGMKTLASQAKRPRSFGTLTSLLASLGSLGYLGSQAWGKQSGKGDRIY